jgi:predicted regulator of Ras-like GTPase activity (Roadblock/LC7/MglB family)
MKNVQSLMTTSVLSNAAELTARIYEKLHTDALSQGSVGSDQARLALYDASQVYAQQVITTKIEGV